MRRRLPPLSCPLSLLALAAVLGGCSSSGSNQSISTSSISPPRPETGMVTEPPQPRTADSSPSYYGSPGYAPPAYGAAPRPYAPPRQQAYAQPTYAPQPAPQRYVPRDYAQGPYGQPNAYPPQQPPAYQAAAAQPTYPAPSAPNTQTTGALPQQQAYGAAPFQASPPQNGRYEPLTTGSIGRQSSLLQVREGDTLFGISRRTGVPVQDIVAANRLHNGRIEIGQQLAIPARAYR